MGPRPGFWLQLASAAAGALIALFLVVVARYLPTAAAPPAEGVVEAAAADHPVWPLALAGLVGAAGGTLLARTVGSRRIPPAVGGAALGCLVGIAASVVVTSLVAWAFGGQSAKEQVPYLMHGLTIGVPVGTALGAVIGAVIAVRRRARRDGPGPLPGSSSIVIVGRPPGSPAAPPTPPGGTDSTTIRKPD
jgi:hypothetical protein